MATLVRKIVLCMDAIKIMLKENRFFQQCSVPTSIHSVLKIAASKFRKIEKEPQEYLY